MKDNEEGLQPGGRKFGETVKIYRKKRGDGLTEEEGKIMDKIVECCEMYRNNLPVEWSHPDDLGKFVEAVHVIQDILMLRIVRRNYPGEYTTITSRNT